MQKSCYFLPICDPTADFLPTILKLLLTESYSYSYSWYIGQLGLLELHKNNLDWTAQTA